jgi:hypothetical protein
MTAEVVDALLWRARSALRVDGLPLFAGHGLADPLYRPPRLPYASVLGPLSYHLEPDRDLPREAGLTVRTPGYLAGATLAPTATLPPPGTLSLLLDGDVRVDVAVDPGGDSGQTATTSRAQDAAARIQSAFDAAVAGGEATTAGTPLADPDRLAEVAATTVRWDDANRRFVVASGRYGPVPPAQGAGERPSRVDLAAPSAHADGLGLGAGALSPAGRLVSHRVPAPIAMAFDVRVDLWAGSQRHLATLVETWARVTPTRCQLLLRPALPAADVMDGATEITLQAGGEAATRWTVLQLEPGGGFADRRSERAPTLSGGAAADAAGLDLPVGAGARLAFLQPPPIPDPFAPAHPAPLGWALATRLLTPAGAAAGETAVVAELAHGATSVLRLEATWASQPPGNGRPPTLACELRATGQAADGTALPAATLRVPAADVEAGVEVHALVDAANGRLAVFADGSNAVGAAVGPVRPAGGSDMELRLGAAAASRPITLGHLQVHARPLGPVDHRHRSATATADRWRPGDPVTLVRTSDGFSPRGAAFSAVVVRVDGATLHLDRPVVGTWPRHDTAVASRLVFSQQTAVRRRDDLASHLTRVSLEHTVSAFVEPDGSGTSARLVEALDLRVLDHLPLPEDATGEGGPAPASRRSEQGAPGVRPELVPARSLHATVSADAPVMAPEPTPPD